MNLKAKIRSAFALVFFTAMLGTAAWNVHVQRWDLAGALSGMSLPRSVQEFRDVCGRLRWLAARHLTGKYAAWESHAAIQQALGKTEMNDFAVLKAPDGRLYRGGLYPLHLDTVGALAAAVGDFASIARERNAKVLYLNAAEPAAKGRADLPSYFPRMDYDAVQDAFLYALREKGVPLLDARYGPAGRDSLGRDDHRTGHPGGDGPDRDGAPKTAFLLHGERAFGIFATLLDEMERRFGASLDPDGLYRDIASYEVRRYPDFFMGELGKETGPAFSGLDAFTTVTPAFRTEFLYEALDMFGNYSKTWGSAEQTILHPGALVPDGNLYTFYPQSYYRYTNTTWSKVTNTLKPDGPRVLVIHDFYGAQVISHLAPVCGEVHTIAYDESFPVNATEYVRSGAFDYVVISFFSQNLTVPGMGRLFSEGGE